MFWCVINLTAQTQNPTGEQLCWTFVCLLPEDRLTCGLLLVTPEHLQLLLQVPDVEQFAQVVTRGRQQPVTVQVPFHLHHSVLMGVTDADTHTFILTE